MLTDLAGSVITEIRLRADQQEILRQRYQFQVTLSSIGDAVTATDAAGTIAFINPVAAMLCGWSEGEAIGKPLATVFRIVVEDGRRCRQAAGAVMNRVSPLFCTQPIGQIRILIAEDYTDLARIMVLSLTYMGFDARYVDTGPQVLPEARSFLPHFLLLDIKLPGLDGFHVAQLIRDDPALCDMVIIAISAYSLDRFPSYSPQRQFDHYLKKPVELDDLRNLLALHRG